MEYASEIQHLFPQLDIRKNQPLCDYTSFQLGGPCTLFIDSPPADQLPPLVRTLNEKEIPLLLIGQGSNLVISDTGLDCAIIRFCSTVPHIKVTETRVTVSGDTLMEDFSRETVENAIGDLSYCTGIPGTVGGGIAGNAGAFGRQIGDHLVSAEILDLDGDTRTVDHSELHFAYRHSILKETGEIVLSATFDLPQEEADVMLAERKRILQFREEHHPDWHTIPCAGSVFRNIEATSAAERRQAAGWFLEEAGIHNQHIGGAKIYNKHANIIIGGEGCTAQNVWDLSEQMKQAVQQKFGIELVREVRFLGKF